VLWSLRVRLRRAKAAEDVSAAADAQKTVRAVPRQELVPELFLSGTLRATMSGGCSRSIRS
jgi:hypothetical protein